MNRIEHQGNYLKKNMKTEVIGTTKAVCSQR